MMRQNVSDEDLLKARHELEFTVNQINDLLPSAMRIGIDKLQADDFASKFVNAVDSAHLDEQVRGLSYKIIGAQARYIRLLERRIGK